MKEGGGGVEEPNSNLPTAPLTPQRLQFGFAAHEESAGNFPETYRGAASVS